MTNQDSLTTQVSKVSCFNQKKRKLDEVDHSLDESPDFKALYKNCKATMKENKRQKCYNAEDSNNKENSIKPDFKMSDQPVKHAIESFNENIENQVEEEGAA